MSDTTETVLHEMGIRTVTFKDTPENLFTIKILPTKKARIAFTKAISLLAPICTHGMDTYTEHKKDLGIAQEELEQGYMPDTPSLSFFDLSLTLSAQVDKPAFHELADMLLEGLTKNGVLVDQETDVSISLDDQLKLIEYAFKENLSKPFMKWLEDMGFTSMVSSLQSAAKAIQDQPSN